MKDYTYDYKTMQQVVENFRIISISSKQFSALQLQDSRCLIATVQNDCHKLAFGTQKLA
jgi:hypothetical protein